MLVPVVLVLLLVAPTAGEPDFNSGLVAHLQAIQLAQEAAVRTFPGSPHTPAKEQHLQVLRQALDGLRAYPHTILTPTHLAWALFRTHSPHIVPQALWPNVTAFFLGTARRSLAHPEHDNPSPEDVAHPLAEQGGVVDSPEAPWAVRVIDSQRPTRECSGVLVAADWVLTAGACAFDVVRAGAAHLISDAGVSEAVAEVVDHTPQAWHGRHGPPDVKLLRLRRPLPLSDSIKPIPLVSSADSDAALAAPGQTPVLYGWGEVDWPSTYDAVSPAARHGQLHAYPTTVLRSDSTAVRHVWDPEDLGQAALFTQRGSLCYSDLGAPLVAQRNGHAVLVAVAAEVTPHARSEYPLHCAEAGPNKWVRASSFAQWLAEHVPRVVFPGAREAPAWCPLRAGAASAAAGVTWADTRHRPVAPACLGDDAPSAFFEWLPAQPGLYTIDTLPAEGAADRVAHPVVGLFTHACEAVACSTLSSSAPWLAPAGAAERHTASAVLEVAVFDLAQRMFLQVSGGSTADFGRIGLRITRSAPLPTAHPSGCVLRRDPVSHSCVPPGDVDMVLRFELDGNPRYDDCKRYGCTVDVVGADLYTSPAPCGSAFEAKTGNFLVLNHLNVFSTLADTWSLHLWLLVHSAEATQTILHSYSGLADHDSSGLVLDLVPSHGGLLPRYAMTRSTLPGESEHFAVTARRDVAPGRWTHVALSQQGRELALYVDGALAGLGTAPFAPGAVRHDTVVLGSRRGGGGFLRGAVDELRVLRTFLEPANVELLVSHPVCS